MDQLFILRVLISFVIAGTWIAFATLFAERFGSKIGGLFGNLPSNILISLIFIAIINDKVYVVNTIPTVPIGMAINTLFLFIFIILLKYGLIISSVISLGAWFLFALIAALLHFENLFLNVLIYFLITIVSFSILEKIIKIPSVKKSNKKHTKSQISIRVLFAGGVVASVIVISKFSSPYIVGIISTFPAVLLSTMIILAVNQSKEFAQATGKMLVLSSSNIVIYVLAVYFSYLKLGIIFGTILSFTIAFLWVLLFHLILLRQNL